VSCSHLFPSSPSPAVIIGSRIRSRGVELTRDTRHAGPLTQLVKRTLSVTNSSNQHAVAYKVKTTAPKQYCVRPNSGRIEPGETVEVHVLLQPMKEDPAPGTKCRDKFLVQSVIITPERESTPLPDLWKQLEDAERARTDGGASEIHEQKIRCAYLPAAESDVAHSPIPEEAVRPHPLSPLSIDSPC
jgi:hypothetical protein